MRVRRVLGRRSGAGISDGTGGRGGQRVGPVGVGGRRGLVPRDQGVQVGAAGAGRGVLEVGGDVDVYQEVEVRAVLG